MKPTRTNKLYNYLVNTYGLSKEMILEYVDARLDQLIDKHIAKKLDTSHIDNLICDRISYYIKNGSVSRYREKESFQEFVKKCIKEEVAEEVRQNYKIKVELNSVLKS